MQLVRRIRIATGASANHGMSLVQLLRSLRKWEPRTPVAVYDLGLEQKHLDAIAETGFAVTRFPYEDYPEHLDITKNAGEYAWKPAIVRREVARSSLPLIWMDAGDVLTFPMLWIRFCLSTVGFYSAGSAGTVGQWTHPGMYAALGLPQGWNGGRQPLDGSCIAFNTRIGRVGELLEQWYAGAMDKSVIAPEGSDRSNHRQDQALLSLLAYRLNVVSGPSRTDPAVKKHRDVAEEAA